MLKKYFFLSLFLLDVPKSKAAIFNCESALMHNQKEGIKLQSTHQKNRFIAELGFSPREYQLSEEEKSWLSSLFLRASSLFELKESFYEMPLYIEVINDDNLAVNNYDPVFRILTLNYGIIKKKFSSVVLHEMGHFFNAEEWYRKRSYWKQLMFEYLTLSVRALKSSDEVRDQIIHNSYFKELRSKLIKFQTTMLPYDEVFADLVAGLISNSGHCMSEVCSQIVNVSLATSLEINNSFFLRNMTIIHSVKAIESNPDILFGKGSGNYNFKEGSHVRLARARSLLFKYYLKNESRFKVPSDFINLVHDSLIEETEQVFNDGNVTQVKSIEKANKDFFRRFRSKARNYFLQNEKVKPINSN